MATSENKQVGDFIHNNALTTVAISDDLSGLLAATFEFKAKKPGTTTLTFEAEVQGETISKSITVKVNCKAKVTTIGEWRVPGPANIFVAAVSGDAEVTADEQGSLKGSTTVDLAFSTSSVLDCDGQSVSTTSQVDLTGNVDDNGQFVMDANYQPASIIVPVHCVGSDGGAINESQTFQLTPAPLQFTVAASGGVLNQSQILQGPEAMPGKVTIMVFPEEEAAAFNPGNLHASLDDFSSLFGILLTLH